MRWLPLALAVALGLGLWFTRPYSLDLLRYGLWRMTAGRAFVMGATLSGDARIAWRTIGPLDPDAATSPVPLLLLHGGLGSDLDWYAEVPTLARTRSLLLIDARGHGGSTLGDEPLSYTLLARDALAVLDALGHRRVDIAGWSDGGNTALALALARPERVRRLVAISVNAHPGGLVERVRERIAHEGATGTLPRRLLRAARSPEAHRWDELTEGVTTLWREHPRLGTAELGAIAAPTLIIAGSEDDVRLAHLDEIARAMPDASLVVLPGVTHAVPQSAPREVLALMARFFDAPAAGAGNTEVDLEHRHARR